MHQYRPITRYGAQVQRRPGPGWRPRLVFVQLLGLVVALGFAAATVGVLTAPGFDVATVEISGGRFTGSEIIQNILGLDTSPNVFRIQTDRAAAQLAMLPAVTRASVEIELPATVIVKLEERTPRMIWVLGTARYVVDQDGVLFGLVDEAGNPIPSNAGPLPSRTPESVETPTPLETPTGSGSLEPTSTPTAEPTPEPTPEPEPAARPGPEAGSEPTPEPAPTAPAGAIAALEPAAAPIAVEAAPAKPSRRKARAAVSDDGEVSP